jgi:RND superfamily putative drug exporter
VPGARHISRIQESPTRSRFLALTGLSATGGVITSAGAVLAGTFAALATLPVTFLAELGFAVAFGVLLDTIRAAGHHYCQVRSSGTRLW